MLKTLATIAVALLLAVGLAPSANADTIVSHPLDSTAAGQFSNLGPSNQQVADEFLLSLPTTLESLSWYGRYGAASVSVTNPVTFAVRFFADASGGPATAPIQQYNLAVNAGSTGLTYGGIPWFSYSATLPGLMLDAGTYWVSVVENDSRTATSGSTQWLWADTTTSGLRAIRINDASAWTTGTDINHAFTITGTPIPEPGTLALFGLGAGLIAWRRRRRSPS